MIEIPITRIYVQFALVPEIPSDVQAIVDQFRSYGCNIQERPIANNQFMYIKYQYVVCFETEDEAAIFKLSYM